jgi:hypothetical protein
MEVSRHPFYVFDLDEHASLMSFVWTEKSVAMTVDDYKDAIRPPGPGASSPMRVGRLTKISIPRRGRGRSLVLVG